LQLFQRRSISGTVDNSTIYALSSAPGKAGVSVVRISGPAAFPAISALTQQRTLQPRHATLCKLTHPKDGELLDEALILTFPKPASFTGEVVLLPTP
jgi:tRNA modification GTPase